MGSLPPAAKLLLYRVLQLELLHPSRLVHFVDDFQIRAAISFSWTLPPVNPKYLFHFTTLHFIAAATSSQLWIDVWPTLGRLRSLNSSLMFVGYATLSCKKSHELKLQSSLKQDFMLEFLTSVIGLCYVIIPRFALPYRLEFLRVSMLSLLLDIRWIIYCFFFPRTGLHTHTPVFTKTSMPQHGFHVIVNKFLFIIY